MKIKTDKLEREEEPVQKKSKNNAEQIDLSKDKLSISNDQYQMLKKELQDKRNALNNVPKFRLKFFGEKASLLVHPNKRQPLMLDDLQHLLMSALLGSSSPYKPDRWCVMEKINKLTHSVILVIEGLSSYHFTSNESKFVKTKQIFEHQLEVMLPKYVKGKLIEELSCIPLTQSYKEKLIRKYGSLEAAVNMNGDHLLVTKSVFPIESSDDESNNAALPDGETFPRTRLLLSPLQMMIEGYPMPLKGEFEYRFKDFKMTRKSYKPVTSKSPMFGLDCEMCRTVRGENELTRVSIVNESYESVYETLVRPDHKITDYLTQWSGITAKMMEGVTKTLEEVQKDIYNLLPPDAILVGQSLNCDLMAMKMMHPYVIDTSVIYNMTGDRNRKTKLQILSQQFLGETIQMDLQGHSSIEDSTACIKLTKLKLSQDIYFGDLALQTKRNIVERKTYTGIANCTESPDQKQKEVTTTIFSHAVKRKKKSAIITSENNDLDLKRFYSKNDFDLLRNDPETQSSPTAATHNERDSLLENIQHHKLPNINKIINKTREVIMENDFNLSYFNIFEDLVQSDSEVAPSKYPDGNDDGKIEELIPQIDKWIAKIWKSVASNGLFVVVFGGNKQSNCGVSMIQIKNQTN